MLNHRPAGCYRYLVALSLSLATFFPLSAEALYQYQYTGNSFTGSVDVQNPDYGRFPIQETISVAFTSANLLSGGEDFEDISNFSITLRGESEHGTRIEEYPFILGRFDDVAVDRVFTISSVNANGLPTDWNISVDVNALERQNRYAQSFIQTSTSLDKTYGYYLFSNDWSGESINNPGTWTVTSPVPEPETYAMMLAGLGMISFVSRRKKQ